MVKNKGSEDNDKDWETYASEYEYRESPEESRKDGEGWKTGEEKDEPTSRYKSFDELFLKDLGLGKSDFASKNNCSNFGGFCRGDVIGLLKYRVGSLNTLEASYILDPAELYSKSLIDFLNEFVNIEGLTPDNSKHFTRYSINEEY